MNKIEVAIIDEHNDPGGMMMFLAKLTQRGHNIHCMDDLLKLYNTSAFPDKKVVGRVSQMPHGTIKRFTPITIAIVGASRRFLAQARTNQVGVNYVSASLQYSDYSGEADFVVPYALLEAEAAGKKFGPFYNMKDPETMPDVYVKPIELYLGGCRLAMSNYKSISEITDNDTAGYAAPQGLRNILIMQANHQAWDYFIRLRSCNRNTVETQYVTMLIWEALLNSSYGEEFFKYSGPDCMFGRCREGKMSCGKPIKPAHPREIIKERWPLLTE